eukprot:2274777-Alexandrium_andersonii.AAC.1
MGARSAESDILRPPEGPPGQRPPLAPEGLPSLRSGGPPLAGLPAEPLPLGREGKGGERQRQL